MNKSSLLIFLIAAITVVCCKKNTFITNPNAQVYFSPDTLYFDTVFTSTGSVTQQVKIINNNNQKILLSDVKLMGGASSVFKININGDPVTDGGSIEIAANDSIYVFVSVYINPSSNNLPFILRDSIMVSYNGNQQYIQLQAWGQNAHFLNHSVITGQTTWTNDLPYVILGSLQIDTNASLIIQSGCKIFMHATAPILVDGNLQVMGTSTGRVQFAGDRLDPPYSNFPGSWPGIFFRGTSTGNVLNYARIQNAYQGVIASSSQQSGSPQVSLNQCILNNISDAGILANSTYLNATNCLISNCGKNVVLEGGGQYGFNYCTVVSYSNSYVSHIMPVLNLDNYTLLANNQYQVSALNALFQNCIFWGGMGSVPDELVVSLQNGAYLPGIQFTHCLWKALDYPKGIDTNAVILNMDPLFDSINVQNNFYNFHLLSGSPALKAGIPIPGLLVDLDGNPRTLGGKTDLGCYQSQQ